MARKVICKITKEQGTSDSFYCVNVNGKNSYYKSKEIYDKYEKLKNDKAGLFDYISNEFFYGQVVPPIFIKKMNEVNIYGYDIILKTFKQKKDAFDYAMTLNFNNDFQKSSYITTIVKNYINEIYKQSKNDKRIDIEQSKDKIDTSVFNDTTNESDKKDISRFFEEDLF